MLKAILIAYQYTGQVSINNNQITIKGMKKKEQSGDQVLHFVTWS